MLPIASVRASAFTSRLRFLLEISGSLRLFGGLYSLKRSLISLLGELGHRATIGIAHTPLAALALARAQENCELPRWPEAE